MPGTCSAVRLITGGSVRLFYDFGNRSGNSRLLQPALQPLWILLGKDVYEIILKPGPIVLTGFLKTGCSFVCKLRAPCHMVGLAASGTEGDPELGATGALS